MMSAASLDKLVAGIATICRSGLGPAQLRDAVLPRLRTAVPVDAIWWACADPATLLFTSAYQEELPTGSGPFFVANEFLVRDVNRWSDLAASPTGVGTLMRATDGRPEDSARYRDFFAPLGLQDELRVALRVDNNCWGYLCLHRATTAAVFSPVEAAFMARVAPHLAAGIRTGLLMQTAAASVVPDGPGLVLVSADGELRGMNSTAGAWLEDLGGDASAPGLPVEVSELAIRLRHLPATQPGAARLQVRTRSGHWATMHASWMTTAKDPDTMAVIIEAATAAEVAPTVMAVYGLTRREQAVTRLVCQGLSTRQIADRLYLTVDTVQDHLKSVFTRTGVHSRGELVATVLRTDYLAHAGARPPSAPGRDAEQGGAPAHS